MVDAAKTFFKKWSKDNVGALSSMVSWNILTSLVPIIVGLLAISGFVLQGNPSTENSVVAHLSASLHGVLTPADLRTLVKASIRHAGLLGVIGLLGALWGGSRVGSSISTAFQAIFETGSRSFIKEKLIDIGMILVMTVLLIVIIAGTTAAAVVQQLFKGFPLSGPVTFLIGVALSLLAGFLLFASIYLAFPNVKVRLRIGNVWRGALAASILFTILSLIWPIYAKFAHFSRYGAVLFPILILTAWISFFSTILLAGGEMVAIGAIGEAKKEGRSVGPEPQETVPQHTVLRDPQQESDDKAG